MGETVEMYMVTDEMAGLAHSTRKRARIILNAVLAVTGPKMVASRLSRTHAEQIVAAWRTKGLSEVSINGYKITLRNFGVWLYEMRFNRTNPFKHLKSVKTTTNHAKRKPLTEAQVHKILLLAEAFHPRDGMCVRLALSTGLRESELVSLTWDDIDFGARVIRARRSKVHDVHLVPMSEQLHDALVAWKAAYAARCGSILGSWYVAPALAGQFVHTPNQRLRMAPTRMQTNLRERLKKYMRMAGVENLEGKGSHTMRRTAANLLLDSGADVRDVMHLLGHASEVMTSRYLDRDTGREKLADRMKDWEI